MMENKRFELCDVDLYEYGVSLNEIMEEGVPLSQKQVVDLLNKLYEENMCLKKMLQDFKTCTNQKSKSKKLKRDYTSMGLYDNTEKELE